MRFVAFKAGVHVGLFVDLPILSKQLIFPPAVTFLFRILGTPAGALFHYGVAYKIALNKAAIGILNRVTISIELRLVQHSCDYSPARYWLTIFERVDCRRHDKS